MDTHLQPEQQSVSYSSCDSSPILDQPTSKDEHQGAGWGSGPGEIPPGLEYLSKVDQLLIKQKVSLCEALTCGCCESANRYAVVNTMGQKVYTGKEKSNCFCSCCCKTSRAFRIKLKDGDGKEVMYLDRPLRCSRPCFFCCLQKMIVEAPKGSVIGIVRQAKSCCVPKYNINDANDQTVLKMTGPCCTCNCFGNVEFKIMTEDESQQLGGITKEWSGLGKEIFTDADNFGVTFPMDLDVKVKATVLAATFLIDFMYFESSGDDKEKTNQWF